MDGIAENDLRTQAPASRVNGRFRMTAFGHHAEDTDNPSSEVEALKKRLARLESLLSQSQGQTSSRTSPAALHPSEPNHQRNAYNNTDDKDKHDTHLRGQSFDTKFNGQTHISLLIRNIPGLLHFTREAFDAFPALDKARHAFHKRETHVPIQPQRTSTPEKNLWSLLPPRDEMDTLIRDYLDSFECIYHVLHLPRFKAMYEELWKNQPSVDENFLCLVLLLVAIALCFGSTTPDRRVSRHQSHRDRATMLIQSCEGWLQTRLPIYNSLLNFQVNFLLLLARQLNGQWYKQTWANAGKILRCFMCAGMHREPSTLGVNISLEEREIRRRLWVAVAEFELQAAFEQGMPAVLWSQQCDMQPPSNIPDELLAQSSDGTKPTRDFTESSYLSASAKSIGLRHSLNTLLNDTLEPITFEEIKDFTDKLFFALKIIPNWTATRSKPVSALLAINVHQYQLALHLRCLRQSISPAEEIFSRTIVWETAKEMIKIHKAVQMHGSNLLELLCGDHVRAALSLCYVYMTASPAAHTLFPKVAEPWIFQTMMDAISLMENRVDRYGGDQRQLWITIAGNALMRVRDEPHRREYFMKEAVDHLVNFFYDILATSPLNAEKEITQPQGSIEGPVAADNALPELICEDEWLHNPSFREAGLNEKLWPMDSWEFENFNFDDLRDVFTLE